MQLSDVPSINTVLLTLWRGMVLVPLSAALAKVIAIKGWCIRGGVRLAGLGIGGFRSLVKVWQLPTVVASTRVVNFPSSRYRQGR